MDAQTQRPKIHERFQQHISKLTKKHKPIVSDYLRHSLAGNYEHSASDRAKESPDIMTHERLAAKHGVRPLVVIKAVHRFHTLVRGDNALAKVANESIMLPATTRTLSEARDPALGLLLSIFCG